MKKSTLISALLIIAGSLAAHAAGPKMIGRRGCGYAVENSREAFERGADLGFKCMECHVRVTPDSVFVAAHDGKTNRLGGNMKIDKMPLDSLLTETYTQTIDGTTYTGARLLTVGEYLDICRQRGLTPLLHLKTLGKNNDDCGPLPALVDLIKEKGYDKECIVLTSSPAYIEFLQERYPDLPLVFQADGKWKQYFDWIVERGLDVDIKSDFVDADVVKKFHDHGLKVMIWTVNTIPDYLRFKDAGVDCIITDTLAL